MRFFTFLLLFVYANLSLALGLSEVELKSHLGEKLFAKVNVIDLDTKAEASCFTASDLSDVPAFKKSNISLKPNNTGHQLTITTNDVITEPIVNLRVSFNCEPNVSREYVLLLDPAPTTSIESENTNLEAAGNVADNNQKLPHTPIEKNQAQEPKLQASVQQTSEAATKPSTPKAVKKKKIKTPVTVDEKLLEAYTGKKTTESKPALIEATPTPPNNQAPINKVSTDKPFLVISGGSAANANPTQPSLSLRLATEIDFSRPDNAASTNAVDTMDEVTVMSNRLAHLEKQITNLQSRNTQLVEEATKAKIESERFNWQKILPIALGAIAALLGLEWLRRRIISQRTSNEAAQWFDAEVKADIPAVASNNVSGNSQPSRFDEPAFKTPNFTEQPPSQTTIKVDETSKEHFDLEGHASILDDADVFIEHGRPALAIQLLQNHLSDSPSESPAIWFKLLNLLAKEGSEAEYDEAVVECNKHFNIKAAKFGAISEPNTASIEDYPHIVSRLEGVWGSQYAVEFLNDLIYNKRSQPREGLEQNAFDDLFFLKTIAKNLDSSTASAPQHYLQQRVAAEPPLEIESFNNALFADISPLGEIEPTYEIKTSEIKTSSKIKPLVFAEATPGTEVTFESIDFSTEQLNPKLEVDEAFEMEEIDFDAIPTAPDATSSAPKAPKANVIEWDLPEIDPKK
ncbi:MAG: hypothetical protein HOP06_06140 [Methylotenera sp.]|nr:hypothetical protein [Methylotenera sp.]